MTFIYFDPFDPLTINNPSSICLLPLRPNYSAHNDHHNHNLIMNFEFNVQEHNVTLSFDFSLFVKVHSSCIGTGVEYYITNCENTGASILALPNHIGILRSIIPAPQYIQLKHVRMVFENATGIEVVPVYAEGSYYFTAIVLEFPHDVMDQIQLARNIGGWNHLFPNIQCHVQSLCGFSFYKEATNEVTHFTPALPLHRRGGIRSLISGSSTEDIIASASIRFENPLYISALPFI